MKVNYHTHSNFCDGKGSPRDYVIEAIDRGFLALGFSGHAPLIEDSDWTMTESNIEMYLAEIESLKAEFKDRITIYKGMEIDFYPNENRFSYFKKYDLDYSIGSVHQLYNSVDSTFYSVDDTRAEFRRVLDIMFDGSIKRFVIRYYQEVRAMIRQGGFNILGHIDLVKKFNSSFDFFTEKEPWYVEEIEKTLKLLKGSNIIVEINTGALSRGMQNVPYPSQWILDMCYTTGINVCLNSDAHIPSGLDYYFIEALEMIRKAGYLYLTTPFEKIYIGD